MAQIEGRRPVLEALTSGRPVRKVLIAGETKPAPIVEQIREAAARAGVPIERVQRRDIERIARSRNPQGVVAFVSGFRFGSLDDAMAGAVQPLVVALDGVTDPHNVGAVARSAEAAGANALVLPQRRSAGVTPAVEKAAAGALAWLPVVTVPNLASALSAMKDRGLWVVALDGDADASLWDCELLAEPVCVVAGSEGAGVGRLVADRADARVRIPMAGNVSSLNVSVAAGVAMFEVLRRRQEAGQKP
jgi:23S rRNA (guanosine2251-2'-O)-methyltransferase